MKEARDRALRAVKLSHNIAIKKILKRHGFTPDLFVKMAASHPSLFRGALDVLLLWGKCISDKRGAHQGYEAK